MAGLFGDNAFKLGLFGVNCSGGCTFSDAPERWNADWDEIVSAIQMSDQAGIEFSLPIARWRPLGESYVWSRSYETFTQAAALGALTRRMHMVVTAHVPLIQPVLAAKSIITVDHVTKGRVALNIVCGWNAQEFAMHGVSMNVDPRYEQGLEWTKIYNKLMEGGPDFDWDGAFYKLKDLTTDPLPYQRPRPPIISAASSSSGQEFAAQCADILFTNFFSESAAVETIARLRKISASFNRNPDIYTSTMMVVRPTRKEAEEYYYYLAEEHADPAALAYFQKQKGATLSKRTREALSAADRQIVANMRGGGERYSGHFPGTHLAIGTPDEAAQSILQLSQMGISGAAMVFLNFLQELPYFIQEVMPRLERLGLRKPVS